MSVAATCSLSSVWRLIQCQVQGGFFISGDVLWSQVLRSLRRCVCCSHCSLRHTNLHHGVIFLMNSLYILPPYPSTTGSVHCTTVSVHCTTASVHCTRASVHCTRASVHCTTASVHWTTASVHCTTGSVHCTTASVHCTTASVHCTLRTLALH
jgi:hypothetical protein